MTAARRSLTTNAAHWIRKPEANSAQTIVLHDRPLVLERHLREEQKTHSVRQAPVSRPQARRHICTMKTQTTQAQSEPDMLGLNHILVPLDFSPASNITAKKERMMEPIVESLATRVALHPFLVGMKPRQLALLTSCAVAIEFKKGQVLCREGELADRFYLIESGRVVLESNGVLDDPLLGCSWMFPPHAWTFTARAVEPTSVIFFSAAVLREYCERDHSLGYELLKRMSLLMYGRRQAARNKVPAVHHRSDPLQPEGAVAVDGADTPDPEVKIVKMYPGENADRECGQIAG